MSEIGTRLKRFALENEESVKQFELNCELSIGIIAKESNIRVDNLAKIKQHYPNIDINYILTGIESELVKSNAIDEKKMKDAQEYYEGIIQSQQSMIQAQQELINKMMKKGL